MFQGDVSKMNDQELERDRKSFREWVDSWAQGSIPTAKTSLVGLLDALERLLRERPAPSIKLGDKCRDTVSGFSGTAVARTIWLNGCVRITIAPNELDKDGKVKDSCTFDAQQVQLVEDLPKPNHAPEVKTGGPTDEPRRAADPR